MIIKDKTQKGTLPDDELDLLLNFMEKNDWNKSFDELALPILGKKKDWFTNLGRGEYYKNIELEEKLRVLDVGAGAGVISQSLASVFNEVYSLEFNSKWVKFLKKRFQQEMINNVNVIRGNAVEFPFAKQSFDLVVVNGVLEWVADFARNSRTADVQQKFLKDIYGLLKTGGKVGIAIENRYYLRWFLGLSPHGEPPYVALMPRKLANFVSKRKQNKEYRNYIYGYYGYKKLLRNAGYKNIEIKLAVPNYYNPTDVISINKESQRVLFKRSSLNDSKNVSFKTVVKWLTQLGWLGYFEHSFYISAEV